MVPEIPRDTRRTRRILHSGPVATLVAEFRWIPCGTSGVQAVGLSTSAALKGIVMFTSSLIVWSPAELSAGKSVVLPVVASLDIICVEDICSGAPPVMLGSSIWAKAVLRDQQVMSPRRICVDFFMRRKGYTENLPYNFPSFQFLRWKKNSKVLAENLL